MGAIFVGLSQISSVFSIQIHNLQVFLKGNNVPPLKHSCWYDLRRPGSRRSKWNRPTPPCMRLVDGQSYDRRGPLQETCGLLLEPQK